MQRRHAAGFVAGTVLIGVGQAVLSLLWLSALPMFSYRTSYLFLLGSHAAATALCAIVLQCPQEWYIPITLASLLAACACATRLRVARPIERTFSSQIADVAPLVGKGVLAVGLVRPAQRVRHQPIGATRHRSRSHAVPRAGDFRLRAGYHVGARAAVSPAVQAGKQLPRGPAAFRAGPAGAAQG